MHEDAIKSRRMKRTSASAVSAFLFAAFSVTLAAAAELSGWQYEPLRDDLRVTDLLEREVVSMTDQPMGRVRDVMLGPDGNFEAMSVEFDHTGGDAFALALMDWSDIAIEPRTNTVSISIGDGVAPAAEERPLDDGGLSARQLIGLPVELRGERFGEVVDILLEPAGRQPTALLVESENGPVYALPARGAILPEEGDAAVAYDLTAQAVRELGQFPGTTASSEDVDPAR